MGSFPALHTVFWSGESPVCLSVGNAYVSRSCIVMLWILRASVVDTGVEEVVATFCKV